MITIKVFNKLKERDNKLNYSQFSREYLGANRNYLHHCKHHNKDISDTALLTLFGNLKKPTKVWNELYEETKSERYLNNYEFYKTLTEEVFEEIERRSMYC